MLIESIKQLLNMLNNFKLRDIFHCQIEISELLVTCLYLCHPVTEGICSRCCGGVIFTIIKACVTVYIDF